MARVEKILVTKYDLALWFARFFPPGSYIGMGSFNACMENGDIDVLSQYFAEFIFECESDGCAVSAVGEICDLGELFNYARDINPRNPPTFGTRCESKVQLLQLYREKLKAGREHYEYIIGEGELNTIERFILDAEEYERNKQEDARIEKAIADHYTQRRAESLDVISSPKLRTLIMERDGAKCKWCEETDGLSLDHVIPVDAGGDDEPENLQLLCKSCNSSKGNRIPAKAKHEAKEAIASKEFDW